MKLVSVGGAYAIEACTCSGRSSEWLVFSHRPVLITARDLAGGLLLGQSQPVAGAVKQVAAGRMPQA